MMDIQKQVQARRAELAQAEEHRKAAERERRAQQAAADEQRKQAALDKIADGLSEDGIPVRREGNQLALPTPPLPDLEFEELRQVEVRKLIDREARKLWTPRENWLVISCIVGGLCLIHVGGLGIAPLLFGAWKWNSLNKRYWYLVYSHYPALEPYFNIPIPDIESGSAPAVLKEVKE